MRKTLGVVFAAIVLIGVGILVGTFVPPILKVETEMRTLPLFDQWTTETFGRPVVITSRSEPEVTFYSDLFKEQAAVKIHIKGISGVERVEFELRRPTYFEFEDTTFNIGVVYREGGANGLSLLTRGLNAIEDWKVFTFSTDPEKTIVYIYIEVRGELFILPLRDLKLIRKTEVITVAAP